MSTHILNSEIDFSVPPVRPEENLTGIELQKTQLGNNHVRSLWAKHKKTKPSPAQRIAQLATFGRWKMRGMGVLEYSNAIEAGREGLSAIENGKPNLYFRDDVPLARLIADWEKHKVMTHMRNELLQKIQELFSPRGHTYAFYRRIGYDKGTKELCRASGKSSSTIEKRDRNNVVPKFSEVYTVVQELYKNQVTESDMLEKAQSAWVKDMRLKYEKLELEDPLATLLISLEIHLATEHACTLSYPNVCEHLDITSDTARMICSGQMVPWEEVERAIIDLCPSDEEVDNEDGDTNAEVLWDEIEDQWSKEWKSEWASEKNRDSFQKIFPQVRDAHNMPNEKIAYCLNIQSPEKRGKEKRGDENVYRPSEAIRNAIEAHRHVVWQAPVAAMIALVSEDPDEQKMLRDLFVQERRRSYMRSGNISMQGNELELRIERELFAVSFDECAEAMKTQRSYSGYTTSELRSRLKHLEEDRLKSGDRKRNETNDLRTLVQTIGKVKVDTALSRKREWGVLPPHCRTFSTVSEMFAQMSEAMKNPENLSQFIRENANNQSNEISASYIREIMRAEKLPALPVLESVCDLFNIPLPEAIITDWHESMPEQLYTRISLPLTRALPRMLTTLIYKQNRTIAGFTEEHFSSQSDITADTIRLLEHGQWPSWNRITRILTALDIQPNSYLWKFARHLYQNDDDVPAALKHIQSDIKNQSITLSTLNFPGCFLSELGIEACSQEMHD